ncbi:MAG: NADH:flavin oxidoreductase/NADH oxidase [Nocardioidaceae bacterium]|nr:NADH:flavin oxidoreductase/NADH oxidase [Nocardioidaceae bacterium]
MSDAPLLFQPLTLRGLTLENRVWLAPMCQYSVTAHDGVPTDWHLVHLGARAIGGFGLVLAEASAVVPEGRITPEDTGIWNDEQVAAWHRVTDFSHAQGVPIGIQLAHAGRKASTFAPWRGEDSVPSDQGGWETVGPSADPFTGYATPAELDTEGIAAVVQAFVDAARRADEAGFDVVELHAAHGYLLHQFVSPLANRRTDEYGGSFENRTRIVVETAAAVRAVWPSDKPLFVRLSATDWRDDGWTVDESARLVKALGEVGVDLADISSGGAVAEAEIVVGPGYQVPFAREVRASSGVPVAAVGLITEPDQAEQVLAEGSADAVFLARVALREPSWPQRAAHELGIDRHDAPYPEQYTRGAWS